MVGVLRNLTSRYLQFRQLHPHNHQRFSPNQGDDQPLMQDDGATEMQPITGPPHWVQVVEIQNKAIELVNKKCTWMIFIITVLIE